MSILSRQPDGLGFFYGFAKPDMRRIDVRYEIVDGQPVANIATVGANGEQWTGKKSGGWWVAYVAGSAIGCYEKQTMAEAAAITWLKGHPESASPLSAGLHS